MITATTEQRHVPDQTPRRQDPIYAALKKLGVKKLRVAYSGSGDSGCIDEIKASDKAGQCVELPQTFVPYTFTHTTYNFQSGSCETAATETKNLPLPEAVEQWSYDLLEEHFAGWENNEGSSGAIAFDIDTRTGELQHEEYFFESNSCCRSFQ
jgi:hypothetical protein